MMHDKKANVTQQKGHFYLGMAEKIFDNVAQGIYVTDFHGRIEYVNPAFTKITGYSFQEILGEKPKFFSSGRHTSQFYLKLWKALREKGRWQGEVWSNRKDGEIYPEWMSLNSFKDQKGETTHHIGIFSDITNRKKHEEMLRLYKRMYTSSIEGIMITDMNGRIIDVNPAFEETTGYTKMEALGQTPKILSSGKQDMTFYIDMWAEIHKFGRWQGEIWNRRKNGEIYPEWLIIHAVKDDEGNIKNYVGIFTDITDRKKAEEKLTQLAHFDMLTDLPNRYLFQKRVDDAISNAFEYNTKVALLFLDLDRFKMINDSLGHSFGDELLHNVAQRLKGCIRNHDTISRLGGDEFTIILSKIEKTEDVIQVIHRIFQELEYPFDIHGHEIFITTSIGVSIFPNDAKDQENLVKNADTAMYRAKEEKGNHYVFYNLNMNDQLSKKIKVENDLRRALRKDELVLHYQPQIDLRSGELIGVEALIRWKHTEFGYITPFEFIPIAEESGLIIPIGEWVLENASMQNLKWQQAGYKPIKMSVNISAHQFKNNRMVETLKQVLDKTRLNPTYLDLEITESVSMYNIELIMGILDEIKQTGVSLSIDDFGTGHSSLSYLKRFPVEYLKIDKTFIRDIANDYENQAIVSSVISMGHGLNMKIVAEGVETNEEMELLKRFDCDLIQGYIYGKPVPAEEFEKQFLQPKYTPK